jgi:hypothetical protein
LLLRARLPNANIGRRETHLPLPELERAPHLIAEVPDPHFFGVELDDVPERLPQLTVFTLENGRPDQSCIRLPPNGRKRQPLLPHFANRNPSRIILSAFYTHTYAGLGQKRRTPVNRAEAGYKLQATKNSPSISGSIYM